MAKPTISVILPAYNEEANISKVVENCLGAVEKFSEGYEIIVVDDGSKDNTGKLADKLQSEKVKVIHHPKNKGYGAALRTGFTHAKYELVFYTDADNQFDVFELRKVLPFIEDSDIVVGYRRNRKDAFYRLAVGKGYNFLIHLLFGIKVRDVDCSFKLFKREVIENIKIEHEGWVADLEILAKAVKKGYSIKEIPVTHYPREKGNSTLNPSSAIFKTLWDLLKLRIKLL